MMDRLTEIAKNSDFLQNIEENVKSVEGKLV